MGRNRLSTHVFELERIPRTSISVMWYYEHVKEFRTATCDTSNITIPNAALISFDIFVHSIMCSSLRFIDLIWMLNDQIYSFKK